MTINDITVGTDVFLPNGRSGRVREITTLLTGQRGRPAIIAVVQLRDQKTGKLIKEGRNTRKVRIRELQVA